MPKEIRIEFWITFPVWSNVKMARKYENTLHYMYFSFVCLKMYIYQKHSFLYFIAFFDIGPEISDLRMNIAT